MTTEIDHPGQLILFLISKFESNGIKTVYLRNHENLPLSVGNDVDLLIPSGKSGEAIANVRDFIKNSDWNIFNTVEFGPISIFLANIKSDYFLHIDLFERLDWHWIPFANLSQIIGRRQWNGQVHCPDPGDELFLNICTRLIYHGTIRDKHRSQARKFLVQGFHEKIRSSFIHHLGSGLGAQLGEAVVREDWPAAESLKSALRREVLVRYGLLSPLSALTGIWRYLARSVKRILSPPGPFVVFQGADGVGKSTVIEGVVPLFKEITGRTDTLLFHWKPTCASVRLAGEAAGPTSDPRAKSLRSTPLSILFLAYHWLGFWKGYLRHVLPARAKNRAVVGDRYAFEFFLDPTRLRMRVPDCLCRLAAATVPQPDVVVCQIAPPLKIIARKPELSVDEIEKYQSKLQDMVSANPRCIVLDAGGHVSEVIPHARTILLQSLFKPAFM